MTKRHRNSLRALAATIAGVALCGGCSGTTTEALPFDGEFKAVAVNDCGPADGPMVSLYLVERANSAVLPPTGAYVRVWLHGTRADVAKKTFTIGRAWVEPTAARCNAAGVCDEAKSGTIRIKNESTNGPIDASVKLEFNGSESLDVDVIAEWRPRTLLCG